MKRFDFDWQVLFDMLPVWESMPAEDRWTFLNMDQYAQSRVPQSMEDVYETEKQTTLIGDDVPSGKRINPRMKKFWKCLRHFTAVPEREYLAREDAEIRDYLSNVLTKRELGEFGGPNVNRYAPFEDGVGHQLSSPEWIDEFLRCDDAAEWEQRFLLYDDTPYFVSRSAFNTAQQLVEQLSKRDGFVPLKRLKVTGATDSGSLLSEVLRGCVRYALLVPALDEETAHPLIGVWPEIRRMINRPPARVPASRQPVESFHGTTLVDDMTSVLVECTAEKVRLRANDHDLFKRHRDRIEERLVRRPEWVEAMFTGDISSRLSMAVSTLSRAGLAASEGREGENLRLEPTEEGRRWLELSAKDRLVGLLDQFRGDSDRPESSSFRYRGLSLVPRMRSSTNSGMWNGIVGAFTAIQDEGFVRFGDFADYAVRKHNPLIGVEADDSAGSTVGYCGYGRRQTLREREEIFEGILGRFIASRLVPLGGVTVGRDDQCQFLFQLEDPGRYLLGLTEDFEYGANRKTEVLVQPNFEVTFLAPSPSTEAEIGRFAERVGQRVGVLFKITRESIQKAAGLGVGADHVLETLRAAACQPLPDNVEHEIEAWFGRCHHLGAREALLVECPDRETAARVVSAAGKQARLLTDTLVELPSGKKRKTALRKLRKEGLFVRD